MWNEISLKKQEIYVVKKRLQQNSSCVLPYDTLVKQQIKERSQHQRKNKI